MSESKTYDFSGRLSECLGQLPGGTSVYLGRGKRQAGNNVSFRVLYPLNLKRTTSTET